MRSLSPWMCVYIAFMTVFIMAPLVVVVLVALTSADYVAFPPRGLSLKWFAAALASDEFVGALRNSFVLGLSAAVCAIMLAVPAALTLVRLQLRGSREIQTFMLAPLTLPQVVLATGLLFFTSQIGLGNTFWGLLAGHVVITLPYVFRTVYGVYAGANREIEEAARVLGANPLQTFFLVTLPLIRPGVLAGGVFAFLISFDEVPIALFLSNVENVTLPVSILSYLIYSYDPTVAAISTLQMAIIVGLVLFLEKFFGLQRLVFASGGSR